jgi:hypothetical protein
MMVAMIRIIIFPRNLTHYNLTAEEFCFSCFPLTPAFSPVCGGEGKGEGAYLERFFEKDSLFPEGPRRGGEIER